MTEQWYAVVNKTTGDPVSFGTVLADPMPDELEAVPIDAQPDKTRRYDPKTRTLVDVPPPPDRRAVLQGDPVVAPILAKLTPAERAALLEKII